MQFALLAEWHKKTKEEGDGFYMCVEERNNVWNYDTMHHTRLSLTSVVNKSAETFFSHNICFYLLFVRNNHFTQAFNFTSPVITVGCYIIWAIEK